MSQYPKDEFDLAAEDRGPKGVHRRPDSPVRRFLPFVLILILGPLLAWGAVSLLNRDSDTAPPAATQTEQASDPATPEPTTDDATDPTDVEPTQDPTEEATDEPADADLNLDAGVSVLNGTGTAGLAGTVAETLTDAGFTDVQAGNYQSALPEVSAVFYQTAELQQTAQHIADLLGIETVEDLSSASNEIVVVLRSDFEG